MTLQCRNKKEGKTAGLLLDDKMRVFLWRTSGWGSQSALETVQREREISSPSHFLHRVGRVLYIPTRVEHPELIHLFIGHGVPIQIRANSFTNSLSLSLLWCAVCVSWPARKWQQMQSSNIIRRISFYSLGKLLSPSAHRMRFNCQYAILNYTSDSIKLLIIAI